MYQWSFWLFTSKESGDFVSFGCKAESMEKAYGKAYEFMKQLNGVKVELKAVHEV